MHGTTWLAGGAVLVVSGLTLAQPGPPGGAEYSYEQVVKETLASLGQLTKALAPVRDMAGAAAAQKNVKEAVKSFLAVRKKAAQLKPPDLNEKDQIEKKYQKKLTLAVEELRAEIRRIKDVPGGDVVLRELDPLFKMTKKE